MKKALSTTLLALLCLLFGLISQKIVSGINYPSSDFFSFWLAGRMIQSHQNPYLADEWISGHHLYGADWISDSTFLYPLPLALFFFPLGLLDLYRAYVLWVWISQVMLMLVIFSLMPLFGADRKHYILPLAAGIILFRSINSLLINGQLGAFLLLVLVLAGILWGRKQWLWGGVILSLTVLKPNIGVPLLGLAGAYLLIHRSYKGLIGIGLGLITMFILAGLYNPSWTWQYARALESKQAQTFGYSTTLWGLSALISGFNLSNTLIHGGIFTTALLVIYVLILMKRRGISPLMGLSLAVTVTAIITPYAWPYDQIMLVLPIVMIMATLKNMHTPYLLSALIFLVVDILGLALFGFSIQIQMENLNALLPLSVLGILTVLLFNRENSER